jgi:phosphoribosylformimino-5-aminoimidazole carboxamide ribotide isomerase
MKFRPCIDLHNGKVKQIVGSTLKDSSTESPYENFATDKPAAEFAEMYQRDELLGGHVIKLGPGNDEAAKSALAAYPQGLQIGGGINDENAREWLDAGASHVIVTSHVFHDGTIDYDRLRALVQVVGKERLVLDLSCRRKPEEPEGPYYVVTDRWQKFTNVPVNEHTLQNLSLYCDEFLIHGVDVEGKQCGILQDLVLLLGKYSPVPVTYAGGVRSIDDMNLVFAIGNGKVDLTIGSALDCFGGKLKYDDVVTWHKNHNVISI